MRLRFMLNLIKKLIDIADKKGKKKGGADYFTRKNGGEQTS